MGTQLPLKRSTAPALFGLCLLWQIAGWMKMPLGTEIGLGPGSHDVLDGIDLPPTKGAQQPPVLTHVY